MILVLDNYDSFTYNLVQCIGELNEDIKVLRNDEVKAGEIEELNPDRVVISPGPGRPENAGIVPEVIKRLSKKEIPMLGVCLGHQAIGYSFGARVIKANKLMHGKLSTVKHDGLGVYEGIEEDFEATRYHSLILDEKNMPSSFVISARSEEGELMGIRHRELPLEGVQFHPESFKTFKGSKILSNFVNKGDGSGD